MTLYFKVKCYVGLNTFYLNQPVLVKKNSMFSIDVSAGKAQLWYDTYNTYKYSDWLYDGYSGQKLSGNQNQNVAFYFVGLHSCLTTGAYNLLANLNYKPGVYNLTVKELYFDISSDKIVEIGRYFKIFSQLIHEFWPLSILNYIKFYLLKK
jgi:hypothetical protein